MGNSESIPVEWRTAVLRERERIGVLALGARRAGMSGAIPGRRQQKGVGARRADAALVERLDAALLTVAHFFSGQTVGDYLAKDGVTDAQRSLFRALRVVRDTPPPVSISTVQHALALSHPAASRLIERCVQEGFVDRVASLADRRHAIVTLTPAGLRAAREVERGRREVIAAVVAAWPPENLSALTAELERLGVDLRRVRERPPEPISGRELSGRSPGSGG